MCIQTNGAYPWAWVGAILIMDGATPTLVGITLIAVMAIQTMDGITPITAGTIRIVVLDIPVTAGTTLLTYTAIATILTVRAEGVPPTLIPPMATELTVQEITPKTKSIPTEERITPILEEVQHLTEEVEGKPKTTLFTTLADQEQTQTVPDRTTLPLPDPITQIQATPETGATPPQDHTPRVQTIPEATAILHRVRTPQVQTVPETTAIAHRDRTPPAQTAEVEAEDHLAVAEEEAECKNVRLQSFV